MNKILLSKFKGTVLNSLSLKHISLSVCHFGGIHYLLCRGAKDCMNKTSLQSCSQDTVLLKLVGLEGVQFFKRVAFIFISATLHSMSDRCVAK